MVAAAGEVIKGLVPQRNSRVGSEIKLPPETIEGRE
jgi:hypothetical protein